ncbi:MAG: hypothetical protein RL500_179 [Pseudomonadota bacterium]|jgi:hypothetical protein
MTTKASLCLRFDCRAMGFKQEFWKQGVEGVGDCGQRQ